MKKVDYTTCSTVVSVSELGPAYSFFAVTEIAEVSPERDEKRRPPNETRSINSVVPDSRRHLARAAFREEMSSAVNGRDRERERGKERDFLWAVIFCYFCFYRTSLFVDQALVHHPTHCRTCWTGCMHQCLKSLRVSLEIASRTVLFACGAGKSCLSLSQQNWLTETCSITLKRRVYARTSRTDIQFSNQVA